MNLCGEEAGQDGISLFHKHPEKLGLPWGANQASTADGARVGQVTDMADLLEKSNVFTAGEFPLLKKSCF